MPGMTTASQPYYTQCPECATLFRVDVLPKQARCGACGNCFNPARRHAQHLPLVFKPFVPEAFRLTALPAVMPAPEAPTTVTPSPGRAAGHPAADGAAAPVRRRRPTGRVAGASWLVASLLLSIGLLAQGLLLQRDNLADHRPLRPLLAALCDIAGCTLRPLRELDAWQLSDAELMPDSGQPGTLLATGRLRHDADQRLELPLLQIELLDAGGRVAHQGVFSADTYLDAEMAAQDWTRGLAPGESLAIEFRLEGAGMAPDQFRFRLRKR
ncbi:zinc-ribbon and DUF3426 domain-containing protein [Methylonatrum kenyense]|uniref:zinc-ribbon and DUF3426 domain-containing protein n=1 Tax=Methylonatrum kenyense TaxID=455253 RepID=UPI0020BFCC70|nr:zinc-ribbon and DUF3426 domain-containing protein [Methylonatrum kenyense]MCK8516144.1 zinc-ribbon and DUF3426 domain-containing protein [Methylonatrum kenyense]